MKNNVGEFTVHNYGFTPIRYSASVKELKKMLGGETLIFGIHSDDNKRTKVEDNKFSGNTIIFSDSTELGKIPKKALSQGNIMDENGFLVSRPDGFEFKISPFGYAEEWNSNVLSAYYKDLAGVTLQISPCDENGLLKTYNGRRMIATATSGDAVPFSDLSQYNSISSDFANDFQLSTTGELLTPTGTAKETIPMKRYQPLVFNQLHLDLDGDGEISIEEESNPENTFPIQEGIYFIKVLNVPLGFKKSENEWMVSVQKDKIFHEIYTRVFKKELNGNQFQLYNKNLILSKKEIHKSENGNYQKLHLSSDLKTIDIGKMPFEISNDTFKISAKLFDEKKKVVDKETRWAFYFKDKTNGKYNFQGGGDIEGYGFSSSDINLAHKVMISNEGKMNITAPLLNHNAGEENVFVLRKLTSKNLPTGDGYYIFRVVNENPSFISKEEYLLAEKVYASASGDDSKKMQEVENIDVNFEFDDSAQLFSSETSKESIVSFFKKFGDSYSTNYDSIPELYRSEHTVDITFYPDGTKPSNLQTAAPPSKNAIEKSGIEKYSYFALFTENTLGDENLLERGPLFGLKDNRKTESTGEESHQLFINLMISSASKVQTTKNLAKTSETYNTVMLVVLVSCSVLFLGLVTTVVYIKFFKKEKS